MSPDSHAREPHSLLGATKGGSSWLCNVKNIAESNEREKISTSKAVERREKSSWPCSKNIAEFNENSPFSRGLRQYDHETKSRRSGRLWYEAMDPRWWWKFKFAAFFPFCAHLARVSDDSLLTKNCYEEGYFCFYYLFYCFADFQIFHSRMVE